jgi:hypothetical protein
MNRTGICPCPAGPVLLAGARHDRHLLLCLDEAHIHRDAILKPGVV